jgi:hypothetical protein
MRLQRLSTASRRNASCLVLVWRETHCGKLAKRFQCARLLYQSVAGLLWRSLSASTFPCCAARLPLRLWRLLGLCLAHDVGLCQWTADARRRSLLSLMPRATSRPRRQPPPPTATPNPTSEGPLTLLHTQPGRERPGEANPAICAAGASARTCKSRLRRALHSP